MSQMNVEDKEHLARNRKKAMSQKPVKRKYRHSGKDLYDEFKVYCVETDVKDKEVWKEIQRQKRQKSIESFKSGLTRAKSLKKREISMSNEELLELENE